MPTTVIIGANRGIGLEIARQLQDAGHRVVATCRDDPGGLSELSVEVVQGVDITRDEGVARLVAALEGREVSHLIIVAGLLRSGDLDAPNFEGIAQQFETNAVGPLRVASACHSFIRKGGKLLILTSRMGSIADNTSGGAYGYRMSKAAVNAAGVSLARDLQPEGIAVAMIHPGYVRTDMTKGNGNVDPDEAASQIIERLEDLELDRSGVFWHANGEELPW